jgi:hypothetical protein
LESDLKVKFRKNLLIICSLALCLSPLASVQAQPQEQSIGKTDISSKTEVLRAADIRYYKTLPGSPQEAKEKGLVEHQEAIELVKQQYLLENGTEIKTDLDNIEYQNYVMSLGSAFDLFDAADMKKIVSFVKFIDLYENYSKNEILANYENKLSQKSQLTTEETEEIFSLMPIDLSAPSTVDSATTSLTTEESTSDMSIQTVFANGYDNIAARDYAYQWWNGRNPVYSTYYAEYNGCKISDKCWRDCANFVSQSLYAGGMKFKYGASFTSNESWHFGPLIPSHTWGGAANFYRHWKDRAVVASSVSDLQTGDAVSYDAGNDGDPDHTAIITRNTGSSSANKYLTQHTSDRKEETTLKNWYDAGYRVYGYEIDKATN